MCRTREMKWQNVHTYEWQIHVHVNKNYYFHKTFDVTGDKFDKQTNTYRIRLHAALQWNRNVLRRRIKIVQINVVFFDYQVRKQIPRAKKGEYIIFKILYLSNIEIQKNFLDNYWLSCSLSTLPITKQHL